MGVSNRWPADIEEGTVVAKPVISFDGRLLLDAGVRFCSEHRRVLNMWGISEVAVEIPGDGCEGGGDNGLLPALDPADIPGRFILNTPLSSMMLELYRSTVSTKKGQIDEVLPQAKPDEAKLSMNPAQLEKALSSLDALPSLPRLVNDLGAALSDPFCSPQRVASIIGKDPALSMRMLRLVNSAFYNFPTRIDQLDRAVTILGIRQICALAQSAVLIETFKTIPQDVIDMSQFIRHAIAVGVTGRLIATYAKQSGSEQIYLAGLLHDVGRLFLFVHFPEQMHAVMVEAGREKASLFVVEKRMLGLDHGEIGARIIGSWNLPLALEKCASYHHHPEKNEWDPVCDVIHAADIVVHAMECGESGERLVPKLRPDVWERLHIPDDRLSALISEAKFLCELFCSIINADEGGNA